MIPVSEIKAAGFNTAISNKMVEQIRLWGEAYENKSPWLRCDTDKNVTSLELPSAIAAEITRLILYKSKSWITGKGVQNTNGRAEWLQRQYSHFMKGLRPELEIACAVGGMVFKPYIMGETVYVDTIANDRFLPCAFDLDGNITEAVFIAKSIIGSKYYTRLEHHKWDPDFSYTIENKIYSSGNDSSLGTECGFADVPQWRGIKPIQNFKGIKHPLFVYFRLPAANNVDRDSAMGISAYARSMNQIRQADEQWERIMWEFQGSELAVMAESGMFKIVKGEADLPSGNKRLYKIFQDTGSNELFKEFAPGIRDSSLFNGLNRIFQRIEFNCGLAYGVISDPQTVEKTAEEVKGAKQRSLTHIQNIQETLEDALQQLISVLNIYADLFELSPAGEYETIFEWGDGVTENRDKEFSRRLQLATAGKLKWEKLLAWYFECSEEKAKEYIPSTLPLFGGDS